MKRIITLILVLVILASILVIPTTAVSIQPRVPVGFCPMCLRGNTDFMGDYGDYYRYYCPSCAIVFFVPKP